MGKTDQASQSARAKGRRQQLILAMMLQPTVEAAAGAVGISRVTACLTKTPEFRQEFLEACRTAVAQSLGRLQQGTAAAASTLLRIMVDPKQPAGSRVRAAIECWNMPLKHLHWRTWNCGCDV